VYESRRRERVARTDGELAARGATELIVDERENFVERLGAPGTQLIPKLGECRRRRPWERGLLRPDHSISIRKLTIPACPPASAVRSLDGCVSWIRETAPAYVTGVCRATLDYVRAVVSRDEEKVEPSTETASVINE
jgi:hypothetical protein